VTRRILVGDSHASGLAAAAARAGKPFVAFESFSGQRTRTIAASGWVADAEREERPIDEVWIVSSGNDRSPDDLTRPVASLLQQVAFADVVWLGPPMSLRPDIDAEHAGTTAKLERLVRGRGVTFIDSAPLTTTGHASDGVHFTSAGYDAWWSGAERAVARARRRPLVLAVTGLGVGAAALVGALVLARR